MACFYRIRKICIEKCPMDYIANGHNYQCPSGLEYREEIIPPLEKNMKNINLLEKKANIK